MRTRRGEREWQWPDGQAGGDTTTAKNWGSEESIKQQQQKLTSFSGTVSVMAVVILF